MNRSIRDFCLLVVLLLSLLVAGQARAQSADSDGNCWEVALPERGAAQLLEVRNESTRLHFVKNQADAVGCPSRDDSCRRKAYLVPGDQVISSTSAAGDWLCAAYVSKAGRLTSGWLPAAALREVPSATQPVSMQDWAGDWRRDEEADLRIEALDDGWIAVSGDATWGAGDPERVAHGAVNIGEIERTEVQPTADVLHLQAGSGAVDPSKVDPEEYSCVLSLQRVGALLLARDNGNCGGMNVRFSGIYQRR